MFVPFNAFVCSWPNLLYSSTKQKSVCSCSRVAMFSFHHFSVVITSPQLNSPSFFRNYSHYPTTTVFIFIFVRLVSSLSLSLSIPPISIQLLSATSSRRHWWPSLLSFTPFECRFLALCFVCVVCCWPRPATDALWFLWSLLTFHFFLLLYLFIYFWYVIFFLYPFRFALYSSSSSASIFLFPILFSSSSFIPSSSLLCLLELTFTVALRALCFVAVVSAETTTRKKQRLQQQNPCSTTHTHRHKHIHKRHRTFHKDSSVGFFALFFAFIAILWVEETFFFLQLNL